MIKPSRLPRQAYTWAAALLLGILFAQAMTSIPRQSITFDEDVHISTGYSIWRTGDLRLVEDHPPLLEIWMSWPLLFSPQLPAPQDVPTWELGDRRLFVRNETWASLPIDSWVIPARIPVTWLALVLGAFLFRWASDWFGPQAGLFVLALFVFDPNILAHSALATLDLGVTCLIFTTMYGVQRILRRPSWPNLIATGISLGLALSAKISAALLVPISVGWITLRGLVRWRRKLVLRLLVYLSAAFLALWAAHLFGFGTLPELPFPLPAPTYWRSFIRVGQHVTAGDRAFLLGESYQGGRWYYFPVALALKTPLPVLILLGISLWATRHRPAPWWRDLVLASFPIGYFAVSITSKINLGYRHLLPILPFMYLFVARLATIRFGQKSPSPVRHALRLASLALLLWQMVGTLWLWPFHLTYFNEIAGGPHNGYRYLSDSNVDWGQGLKALRDYLEARPNSDVQLSSYLSFIRPELYGIQATPLPPLADAPPVMSTPFNPAPGTYIISASTLRGLQLPANPEMYNWFWHREPDDIVANALLVYRVTKRTPTPTWLAQCSVPAAPLPSAAVAQAFGRSDLRLLTFDCTQSWLYPDAGESAGWYVLHREATAQEGGFIQRQLARARLSFEQKIPRETPPLTVYEWDPQVMVFSQEGQTLWVAPIEWVPSQVIAEGALVETPITLDGPLLFLGHGVSKEEQTVTLFTHWQVIDKPNRPFSLMAHLVNAEGRPVAVGDGLGVPWEQLQPGDVVVQRHPLSAAEPLAIDSHWLQTGAYWLDTMERWAIVREGIVVGDRILLMLPQDNH